jgi:hypothetical protein
MAEPRNRKNRNDPPVRTREGPRVGTELIDISVLFAEERCANLRTSETRDLQASTLDVRI